MTLATETDPVETIRLLLDDNTANADWSNAGGKPSVIEKVEEKPFNIKLQRSPDAVYIWSPDAGEIRQHDAGYDAYQDVQFVAVATQTKTSAAQAHALARDVRELTLDKATDNFASTNWQYIRPQTEDDLRHEKLPNRADGYEYMTLLELFADREPS